MIRIRSCAGFEELAACVGLQIETWGYDETEVIPSKTFLLAQKIGGQVLGAFDAELGATEEGSGAKALVGFALSLPGVKTVEGKAQAYLHSHMLAVREGWRDRGIGVELKREQRREAIARGITRMEWTFDPLEIKNAYVNIHRLGAVAREYRVNFYGVSSSRLQGGLPTDRLLAEWAMDSPRVRDWAEGRRADAHERKTRIELRIGVPASIYQWKAGEAGREQARAVLLENRRKFEEAFAEGLAVLGFARDAEGNGVYQLGRLQQPS
jgi:predicted GNAT superfamily acetyltransferase